MTYTIEISFDLRKNSNITEIKRTLSDLAEKYNATTNYFTHEIEGHSVTIDRNDCINTITFNSDNTINLIKYIKNIKKLKFVKFDCIYSDTGEINKIYTSKNLKQNLIINPKKKSTSTKTHQQNQQDNEILKLIK